MGDLAFLARDVSTRGDLAFLELLVRGWKTSRGNPVVEFNLDSSVFPCFKEYLMSEYHLTFHLSLHFDERSVPVDFHLVVARVLEDKLSLQYLTLTPNVVIAPG